MGRKREGRKERGGRGKEKKCVCERERTRERERERESQKDPYNQLFKIKKSQRKPKRTNTASHQIYFVLFPSLSCMTYDKIILRRRQDRHTQKLKARPMKILD